MTRGGREGREEDGAGEGEKEKGGGEERLDNEGH